MKTVVFLLIWFNCTCPSSNVVLTAEPMAVMSSYTPTPVERPYCEPQIKHVDSLDPLLDQMAKEQMTYGIVQPRTKPELVYRLTLKGGKVIDSTPVVIEPVIEKSKEWVEQERQTIKGFKAK
jgi:hypothetical protein